MLLLSFTGAVDDRELWRLGALFFLAPPISALMFRWLVTGRWWLVAFRRSSALDDLRGLAVMQLAFMVNAVFCLVMFLLAWQPDGFLTSHWQAGAYFTCVTALTYRLQLVNISCHGRIQRFPQHPVTSVRQQLNCGRAPDASPARLFARRA